MPVSVRVDSFNVGTGAAGTQFTVDVGFGMKAMRFFTNGDAGTTDSFTAANNLRSLGFATWNGSTAVNRCVASRDQTAAGTAICDSGQRVDSCIAEISGTGTWVGAVKVLSVSGNIVTFERVVAFTISHRIMYIAYGGDIAGEIGQLSLAATGNLDKAGQIPDAVFFITAGIVGTGTAVKLDSSLSHGCGVTQPDATVNQGVWFSGGNEAATVGSSGSYCRLGEIIAINQAAPAVSPTVRASYVGKIGTGFRINVLERNATIEVFYLSLTGGAWCVGSFITPTFVENPNPDPVSITGLPFQPKLLDFVSAGKPAGTTPQDTTPAAHDEWNQGATDGTRQILKYTHSRNGNTTITCRNATQFDAIIFTADPVSGGQTTEFFFTSFDSGGFTYEPSESMPPVPNVFVWYVALSDAEAPAIEFAASWSSVVTSTVALTTAIQMAGSWVSAGVMTPALTTQIRFAANWQGAGVFIPDTLTTQIRMATNWSSVGVLTPALTTQIPLGAIWSSAGVFSSTLTTQIRFASNWSAGGLLGAGLQTEILLAGSWVSTGSLATALETQIRLAANLVANGLFASDLLTISGFGGTWVSVGSFSPSLSTAIELAGSWSGLGSYTVNLQTQIQFALNAQAEGQFTADLAGDVEFRANWVSLGLFDVDLETQILFIGSWSAQGSLVSQFETEIELALSAEASGSFSASFALPIGFVTFVEGFEILPEEFEFTFEAQGNEEEILPERNEFLM